MHGHARAQLSRVCLEGDDPLEELSLGFALRRRGAHFLVPEVAADLAAAFIQDHGEIELREL